MPRLYLVRHAESPCNLDRTFSCRHVDPPLTERGVAQARALADWFVGRPIAHVYSGPLQRARLTAQEIARATSAPLTVDEALRELDVGELEGRCDQAAWDAHDAVIARWWRDDRAAAFPGGESYAQIYARLTEFFDRVRRAHPTRDVVAVGHGGIFCSVLPRVCAIPHPPGTRLVLDNTAVTILRSEADLSCEVWNGLPHLAPSAR